MPQMNVSSEVIFSCQELSILLNLNDKDLSSLLKVSVEMEESLMEAGWCIRHPNIYLKSSTLTPPVFRMNICGSPHKVSS